MNFHEFHEFMKSEKRWPADGRAGARTAPTTRGGAVVPGLAGGAAGALAGAPLGPPHRFFEKFMNKNS